MDSAQLTPPPSSGPHTPRPDAPPRGVSARGDSDLAQVRTAAHPAVPLVQPVHQPPHTSATANGHNEDLDHDRIDLNVKKPKTGWIIAVVVIVLLALGALLAVGLIPRLHASKELAADAEAAEHGPILVNVSTPHRAESVNDIVLPGTLRPWKEVSIFARTTGYLKDFKVDISEQVKKGQLMADIESPEVDQQLRGAQAAILQAQAAQAKSESDLKLANVTLQRFQALKKVDPQGVTELELEQYGASRDVAAANLKSAQANVASAQAEVQRLIELQGFEKVTAPFSGVVAGRSFDPGAMIIANPTSADIKPMFKIAENDVLRVFVNVPQSYALAIKKGMDVRVTARERPGRVFTGKVMGTTNYLDPTNRSLLTEIKVANPEYLLLPGMYVEAKFTVTRDRPPLLIPAPALVTDAEGNQVAVVKDGKVHFQTVELGVDYGKEIEITSGLTGNERIISNPGERTGEGVAVKIANDDRPAATPLKANTATAQNAGAAAPARESASPEQLNPARPTGSQRVADAGKKAE